MKAQQPAEPSHEAIAVRAYRLWTQAGEPVGDVVRHWLQAEAELTSAMGAKPEAPVGRSVKRAPGSCP